VFENEGCRPQLPWGQALTGFKRDPAPVLVILERLKADPSLDRHRLYNRKLPGIILPADENNQFRIENRCSVSAGIIDSGTCARSVQVIVNDKIKNIFLF